MRSMVEGYCASFAVCKGLGGPGGVVRGGEIAAEGTPEEVPASERSFTERYLAPMLERVGEAAE